MALGPKLAFGEQPSADPRAWLGSQYDADDAPLVWSYVRGAARRSKPTGALSSFYYTLYTITIAQSNALEAFAERSAAREWRVTVRTKKFAQAVSIAAKGF